MPYSVVGFKPPECTLILVCLIQTLLYEYLNGVVNGEKLEKLTFGRCLRQQNDVIIHQISLVDCFEECRSRGDCFGISYRRTFLECRNHMGTIVEPIVCQGSAFSSKANWEKKDTTVLCNCDAKTTCSPKCKDCTALPPQPENGYILGNDVRTGSKIQFRCNGDTDGTSTVTSVCEDNGRWTVPVATCQTPCPPGWFRLETSCYKVNDAMELTYGEAQDHCQLESGGHLVYINSEEEYDRIAAAIQQRHGWYTNKLLIGVEATSPSGPWKYTGTQIDITWGKWNTDNPTRNGPKTCVYITYLRTPGEWFYQTQDCAQKGKFICEKN